MSYDGQTSRNHKFVHHFYSNVYTQVFPNMSTFHNTRRHTNTFGVTFLRMDLDAPFSASAVSNNFENTLGSNDLLTHRCMWFTNATASEKYYPPISQGIASSRYIGYDNFSNQTSNSETARTDWEV